MTGCSIVIAVVVTLFDMTILRATRYKTTEAERGTTSVSAESSSSIITPSVLRSLVQSTAAYFDESPACLLYRYVHR